MRILVLNGSPRKNGNTARMVGAFEKGAKENGHVVSVAQVGAKKIQGCKACEHCKEKEPGVCVLKDDMQEIYKQIMEADMIIFASPIYYFTMTGQIISAINRTYALGRLSHVKKTALFLCSASSNMYDSATIQYKGIANWWGAKDMGVFTATGLTHSHDLHNTSEECLQELYAFGKKLK